MATRSALPGQWMQPAYATPAMNSIRSAAMPARCQRPRGFSDALDLMTGSGSSRGGSTNTSHKKPTDIKIGPAAHSSSRVLQPDKCRSPPQAGELTGVALPPA